MMFWIIFFAVLAVMAAGYFFSILPATSRRQECLKFAEWNYAHRGLWNAAEGVPENSLPAFARAAEQDAGTFHGGLCGISEGDGGVHRYVLHGILQQPGPPLVPPPHAADAARPAFRPFFKG